MKIPLAYRKLSWRLAIFRFDVGSLKYGVTKWAIWWYKSQKMVILSYITKKKTWKNAKFQVPILQSEKNNFAEYLFLWRYMRKRAKMHFHHNIMKYDSASELFRKIFYYLSRKVIKNYIFGKLFIFMCPNFYYKWAI